MSKTWEDRTRTKNTNYGDCLHNLKINIPLKLFETILNVVDCVEHRAEY